MANRSDMLAKDGGQLLLLSVIFGIASLIFTILVFLLPDADQSALTAPLVCFSVIFTLTWCMLCARDCVDGKIDWFHPSILLMMVYLAYYIFSGVWIWLYHDYDSIFVNLGGKPAFAVNAVFSLGFISIVAFGLGTRTKLAFSGKTIQKLSYRNDRFSRKWTRNLIGFFLVIGTAFKLYHLSLLGTLSFDVVRYLSPSAYLDLRINLSQFNIMLESMLDWAVLLAIFYYIVRYKETGNINISWLILLILLIAVVLPLDYIVAAKRSAIIPLFLLPLIWYHYLIKRLTLAYAGTFFLVGLLAIIGLLMVRIVLPLLAQDLVATDYIGESLPDMFAFYVDTGEWSTFDMIAASVVHRDELLKQAGGSIFGFLQYSFSTLIVFIPRAIWADKPDYEDLSQVYFRVLVGGGGSGIAPTIWGASFLFFHLVGLIIGMFVLGWLFKSIYAMFQPKQGRLFNVYMYSIFYWMAFQFLRFGTMGFILIIFIQSMIVGVLTMLFLRRIR